MSLDPPLILWSIRNDARSADAFIGSRHFGCPRLRHSVATFECATYSRHAEGDHTILLGRVDRHVGMPVPAILLHQGQMGSLWELAQSTLTPSRS